MALIVQPDALKASLAARIRELVGCDGVLFCGLRAEQGTCRFCTESMPFYQTLSGTPIVWVPFREDVETNRRYLESHGIKAPHIVSGLDAGLTRISATPTMVLIGRDSTVVNTWIGRLPASIEKAVVAALRQAL